MNGQAVLPDNVCFEVQSSRCHRVSGTSLKHQGAVSASIRRPNDRPVSRKLVL